MCMISLLFFLTIYLAILKNTRTVLKLVSIYKYTSQLVHVHFDETVLLSTNNIYVLVEK